MKKGQVDLKIINVGAAEDTITIKALLSEHFAIHRDIDKDTLQPSKDGYFEVSHINTGYKCCSFELLKWARKYVRLLESSNINWNNTDPAYYSKETIRKQALELSHKARLR